MDGDSAAGAKCVRFWVCSRWTIWEFRMEIGIVLEFDVDDLLTLYMIE